MLIKNIHEKLSNSINFMLINRKVSLPYYGNFNLFINFQESKRLPTCAVNITYDSMNFYYNTEFLNRLSQKEVNFVVLHENFHLLWDHVGRTSRGKYDRKLSNIAQDMIINHIIWQDIDKSFVEIPKDEDGKNMALFVPKNYNGKLIFEELYAWLADKKEEFKNKKEEDKDLTYGPHCKNPLHSRGNTDPHLDGWSPDKLFDDMEKNACPDGYLDSHIEDEASEEYRESMIKNSMDRLKNRGLHDNDVEKTLEKLRKKKKDYLSYIKRSISNEIFGTIKVKTITKPNRKLIEGLKGRRKTKSVINCILDTSGSMGNTFDKVLSYIYRNDIEVNLIEADTKVSHVQKVKNKKQLQKIPIKGLGGTILQPAVDLVVNKFNNYNTLILTDGYCDMLDLSKNKGNVLIITIGVEVPIANTNGKIKQIKVEE